MDHQSSGNDTITDYSSLETISVAYSTVFLGAIGDKTFFIAALMAMRYGRFFVLLGSSLSLCIILAFSAALGSIVTALISKQSIDIIVVVLFLAIGVKMTYEGITYKDDGQSEKLSAARELKTLEDKFSGGQGKDEAVVHSKAKHTNDSDLRSRTESKQHQSTNKGNTKGDSAGSSRDSYIKPTNGFVFLQALSMTFFAEWGDRSQIYTIALASKNSAFSVFIGAWGAHVTAIVIAVIFGSFAANKIKEKWLFIAGGTLYLILGLAMLPELYLLATTDDQPEA